MAKYLDDNSVGEHPGLVNLLGEDDDSKPALPLLGSGEEPATFCVRCRSLSNASSILPYEGIEAGTREWLDSLQDVAKNGAVANVVNGYHPVSCTDDADLPLLANGEMSVHRSWQQDNPDEWDRCHSSNPPNLSQTTHACRRLLGATILCLIFMGAEAVGGYLAGSLAVLTDAAHLLSDLTGFGGSLLALWLSRRPASRHMTFGWARAEPLAALASVVLLWAVTATVAVLAVRRLLAGNYTIDADMMMLVAAMGVIINIIMGLVLHGGCHGLSTGHGHSHGLPSSAPCPSTTATTTTTMPRNINVRAAVVHVVGDLIQSIGVFVAAVLIKFCPGARWADPACTLLCCVLVLCTSAGVARDAVMVLLEASPSSPHLQPTAIVAHLQALDGVRMVHDVHVWSLTPGRVAITAHLVSDSSADNNNILQCALWTMRSLPEVEHVTLQISNVTLQ